MKTIKCELCGSTSVTKVDSIYQCDYCKTKYSIEEAKKLITDMRVVGIEEYANYLTLARKAKEEENVENAEKYYGMVLRIDSNNWEAKFYNSYYAAIRTTLFDIENSIQRFIDSLSSTIEIISRINDNDEITRILVEISGDIKILSLFFIMNLKSIIENTKILVILTMSLQIRVC